MKSPKYWIALACTVLLAGLVIGQTCIPQPDPVDTDGDGVNADQADADGDDVGDACDDPAEFDSADAGRGGALYDRWWSVTGDDEPTEDHALWATRPDTESNTRTGADTWRCKECHGWDYKGVDGAYGSGSHTTGIAGIFGTTMTAREVFDVIGTDHGYSAAGLADADIWDLAKFVFEGQIDTDTIIDADGGFTGAAAAGETLFSAGIAGNPACMLCHGVDGLGTPPGADAAEFGDFVGLIANENPWEFQHKVRFGQPGTSMPSAITAGGTTQEVSDLGTHAQTLPEGP